jgi:leucyl aminopeptidase (aminopeptidase T)
LLELEVVQAAAKLCDEVLGVKSGERALVLADTASDMQAVLATAAAARNRGAKVSVMWYETILPNIMVEPPEQVAAAMKNSDIIIDYAVTLYTKAQKEAVEAGARFICLSFVDSDLLVRCVGKVDLPKLLELGEALVNEIRKGKTVRITSEAGMDLTCKLKPTSEVYQSGSKATKPGDVAMLAGQVTFSTDLEEVDGTIVFDGTLWPPNEIGLIKSPVRLEVEKGKITAVKGGWEAKIFERWLRSFNDPNMFNYAHVSLGFNPGVRKLTGRIAVDERFFGSVVIGIGHYRGRPAKNHTDGVALNPTIEVDGVVIEKDGMYVKPNLAKICAELGVL